MGEHNRTSGAGGNRITAPHHLMPSGFASSFSMAWYCV